MLEDVINKNLTPMLGVVGVVVGSFWTLWVYTRNNRIKTAEFLLQLEKEYATHIETFLALEYDADYKRRFKNALKKQITESPDPLSPKESQDLNKLESALRFFFVSLSIKWLRLDAGYVDCLNAYYLRKLRKHPELSTYVEMYWPQLFFWSDLAGRPLPVRLWRYAKQLPARWNCYWHGCDNFKKRSVKPYEAPNK